VDDLTLVLSAATGLQHLPAKMIALLLLAGGVEVKARQLATRMSPHRRLRHAQIEALAADVSPFVGEVRTARAYAMSADGFAESWRLMGAVSDAIRQEIARLDGLDQ
jgi:outer membrane murein-binding lipoprotein Lpp